MKRGEIRGNVLMVMSNHRVEWDAANGAAPLPRGR